jgi:dienelactone hydrolase
MRLAFFYSLLFLASVGFSNVNAQQTAKVSPKLTGYLEYLPQGYNNNTDKYPIVISLHGIKEKGTTSTNITDIKTSAARVANVGLPKYVKYGAQYPFILISPQLKSNMGRWTGDYVMEVLNYVKTYLRVDPNRIYLTGLSLGGGGVWSVATAYPSVWASILPICSGYNIAASACKLASVNLPVWGFHGDADNVVSYNVTVNMINAINNCSPKCSPGAKVTIFPGLGHVIWDKVYKETSALNWMLSYRKGSTSIQEPVPTNAVPVANAGANKSITLPTNSVTITGSATDSDGTIASYIWTKKSGSTATLSGAATKTLSVSSLVAGTYVFTLTVKDDKGATDTDDVTVTVNSSTTTTNTAPIANAGANIKVSLPTSTATIRGSATDSEGNIASYTWTKVSGAAVSMSGTTTTTLGLSGLKSGNYVFRLTVKDSKGAVDTDDMLVTVSEPPVVAVGSDRTITLPYSSLVINATASDDGTIGSYLWTKTSGPSLKLTNATTKSVTLSGFFEGTYVIRLTVKDNMGLSAYDELKITVKGVVATIESQLHSGTELAALFDVSSMNASSLLN